MIKFKVLKIIDSNCFKVTLNILTLHLWISFITLGFRLLEHSAGVNYNGNGFVKIIGIIISEFKWTTVNHRK